MKEFNLQVNWNKSEEKYDVALNAQNICLGELIESFSNIVVHSLKNTCGNDYDTAMAATAVALLIGEKTDSVVGDNLTLKQKQKAAMDAMGIVEEIGGND